MRGLLHGDRLRDNERYFVFRVGLRRPGCAQAEEMGACRPGSAGGGGLCPCLLYTSLVAHDLVPSDTADLDREKVLAILTEVGGPTSHCAIIAKSYGIPAILGIPGLMDEVGGGALLAVDACSGTVELDPDERCVAENKRLAEEFRAEKERTDKFKTLECRTADGVPIDR